MNDLDHSQLLSENNVNQSINQIMQEDENNQQN